MSDNRERGEGETRGEGVMRGRMRGGEVLVVCLTLQDVLPAKRRTE